MNVSSGAGAVRESLNILLKKTLVMIEADSGRGLRGLQPLPLGRFQTCLATHVYPFSYQKLYYKL